MDYVKPIIYPDQNDKPSVVFVFGAGASYSGGVPLQNDIIPMILTKDDIQLLKSNIGSCIKEFIRDFYHTESNYPSLEAVFGLIDYHIINEISLSSNWTYLEMIKLKSNLIKVIHYLISGNANKSESFHKFWDIINAKNKHVGIITTNYDTLIDDSFDKIYDDCLIDYCIDIINVRDSETITPFWWWVDPKKPFRRYRDPEPTRIKLIKIHGSLNWKYCDCCGQIGLTPWDTRINLKTDSFESVFSIEANNCPFDGNKLISLIQPPSYIKYNNNYIFNKLNDEASFLFRYAEKIVFIGYSFPDADVHIKAMINRNFNKEKSIYVINPDISNDFKSRYNSLSDNVTFFNESFDDFVNSNLFLEILTHK